MGDSGSKSTIAPNGLSPRPTPFGRERSPLANITCPAGDTLLTLEMGCVMWPYRSVLTASPSPSSRSTLSRVRSDACLKRAARRRKSAGPDAGLRVVIVLGSMESFMEKSDFLEMSYKSHYIFRGKLKQ